MRSEPTALFRWAFVWEALTPLGLGTAQHMRRLEHECVDVNDLGNRYRRALSEQQKRRILSNYTKKRLSHAIGVDLRPLQKRYWDSVVRKAGQPLVAHTDVGEPGRRYAVAIYVNKKWEDHWGGAIFLHDRGVNIPFYPVPNSALIFEVNDHSLHAVQDILVDDVFRHAIVGWFYDADAPACDPSYSRISKPVDVWTPGLTDSW